MRAAEELERDAARLRVCAELEGLIERVAKKHPGMSLRELAEMLPAEQGTQLLALIDELEIWSR